MMNVMDKERVDALIFDYIEGEMDPSMRADFQSWLKKDESLQKRVRDLGGLRRQVKAIATDVDIERQLQAKIESRMGALHDQIMARVEVTQPQPRILARIARITTQLGSQQNVWKTAAAVAFAVLATSSVMHMLSPQSTVRVAGHHDKTVNQMMVDASMRSPEVVGEEGLSSEDQIDMYMDIMAQRMGKMDDRQNKQLMDELKQ